MVFYDGVCGLCNKFVRFLLRRDSLGRILYAPLQGELAHAVLTPRGYDPADLDTIYVVADWQSAEERVLSRSRAVLHTLSQLGAGWPFAAGAGTVLPLWFSDTLYRLIARKRYRTFGRLESCPLPPAEWKERFLD